MIDRDSLEKMGIRRIIANCQFHQDSYAILVDIKNPDTDILIKPLPERVFIPFTIDITGETDKRIVYIGEYSGYLGQYILNYGDMEKALSMEDVAQLHRNPVLLDFTTAILSDKGLMPKRWVQLDEYFIILLYFKIYPKYRRMGLATHIIDNLQKIIRFDTCIPAACVFLPPPVPEGNTEEAIKACEGIKTSLRRLGFREIGHDCAGYFTRRVDLEY